MSMEHLTTSREHLGDSAFYVYEEKLIKHNIKRFKSLPYTNASVHFASMANDNPALLSMLKEEAFGLFVNSRKHLELGLSLGFKPEQIVFASTGISAPTMRLLGRLGVRVNIDSRGQLEMYGQQHRGSSLGIRLNIDEKSKNNVFIGAESRIGMLESELPEVFAIARKYNLKLIGTHVYLGTDVTSLDDLLTGVDKTLELSDHFEDLEFVDLGGGFPIQEERFDFEQYKHAISERLENYSRKRGRSIHMVLEPGRAVFGNTAFFCAQVTDVKERPDRYLVCLNASATLIPRAMFYEDYNPVSVLRSSATGEFDKPVDIVGSTTYSRDFIGRKVQLQRVNPGDWLKLHCAGSYCYAMITRFLGQAMPPEFLIRSNGEIELIREGESFFADADEADSKILDLAVAAHSQA
jgi:diaminopimelate decarboxylase